MTRAPATGCHVFITAAALIVSLAGCDAAREVAMPVAASAPSRAFDAIEIGEAPQDALIQPRLIRNARASIEVSDVEEAVRMSRDRALRSGGIVAESEMSVDEGRRSASLLLRIPADSLDDFLADLAAVGEVQSTGVSSTDVSREYFDVETRLAVKEETVRRLTQLMERAGSVQDLVLVEKELSRATTELESLKGQIRYFDLKVADSDVRVYLFESGSAIASSWHRIRTALSGAADVLGQSIAALVYVVVFLSPWALVALLAWFVLRRYLLARRGGVSSPVVTPGP